ncbi:MAG: hypothetical protein HDS68_00905 [Bacteroidales bacterium]|nr:hypothetical protein [Bacteroidales bacterium]
MKKGSKIKFKPLTLEEMRVIGSDRLSIKNEGDKCVATFQCYSGAQVSCSGAKNTCNSVETNGYIVGVSCQGVVEICSPAFPENPSGTDQCKDLQKVACASLGHNSGCSWTCNGTKHSGTCLYNPLDMPWNKGLFCSDTGFGTRIDEEKGNN